MLPSFPGGEGDRGSFQQYFGHMKRSLVERGDELYWERFPGGGGGKRSSLPLCNYTVIKSMV